MSYLPNSVTQYNFSKKRRCPIVKDYKNRVLEDEQMHYTDRLIDYGNKIFNTLLNVIDLTDIDSIKVEKKGMVLPPGFVPVNQAASDFILKLNPHNGAFSLRRGFYRLLPVPESVTVLDANTWQTNVLYNEGQIESEIYKYTCHVGPLVNACAVLRNLTVREFIDVPEKSEDRKIFLQKLETRTIYVSSAEMVHIEDNRVSFNAKEVLWFVW